ncbi:MAG: FtsH protease activity modulator HflK [Treponema sp.]|nr:FtsH protease activity modulator HflK [Treponema sp.]
MKFNPQTMGKLTPKKVVLIVVGILALILVSTSVFIVDQTEQAVMTRFGRFIGLREPGLHFKLPFGIDRNQNVNVRTIQSEEFGHRTVRGGNFQANAAIAEESIMLTGDLNIIDIQWNIQFRIDDARAWAFNVQERRETIRDVSRSVINMLVGDRAIMDIMGIERSAIESEALYFMNNTFRGYGLGINVIAVNLQNVLPPAGVQRAFEDVNMAMQDRERLINEGIQIRNEELPRAVGEAERIVHLANAYAAERLYRAIGSAARFNAVLDEYLRAPVVTRQRLYYETIEEMFRDRENMVIIDHNLQNFLPLMNLGGR